MTMNSNICKDNMNSWNMDESDQRSSARWGTLSAYTCTTWNKCPSCRQLLLLFLSICFCHLICQPWQQMPRSLIGTTLFCLFYLWCEGEQIKEILKQADSLRDQQQPFVIEVCDQLYTFFSFEEVFFVQLMWMKDKLWHWIPQDCRLCY